jgi:hypothetical protein
MVGLLINIIIIRTYIKTLQVTWQNSNDKILIATIVFQKTDLSDRGNGQPTIVIILSIYMSNSPLPKSIYTLNRRTVYVDSKTGNSQSSCYI